MDQLFEFLSGANPWLVFGIVLLLVLCVCSICRSVVYLVRGFPKVQVPCPKCGTAVAVAPKPKSIDED